GCFHIIVAFGAIICAAAEPRRETGSQLTRHKRLKIRPRRPVLTPSRVRQLRWQRIGGASLVAASKAVDLGGERPLPSIARFGRLVCPMRGEATNRDLLGCKRHGRPASIFDASGGDDLGGKQTRRPEDNRMTAAA